MIDTQADQVTDYTVRWQDLRRYYGWLWALMLTFFPVVGGIGFGLSAWLGSLIPFFVVAVCWAVPMVVVNLHFTGFACPRCGEKFFQHDGLSRPSAFEPRCVHCGLPKWAPGLACDGGE